MAPSPPYLLPVSIRDYEAGDAAALGRVFFEAVRNLGIRHYSAEQVRAWAPAPIDPRRAHARATDGHTTLVAVTDDGEVVAYGDLEANGHVEHLYCRPDAAGARVGSRLIANLITRAQAMGGLRLYVEASEGARPVFERMGFSVVGRRDFLIGGVPIHNYAMERSLA
jgi:putative acetyltransferase